MSFSLDTKISESFSPEAIAQFKKMNTPAKVQDFLNSIPFNFEEDGMCTIKSPLRTLSENNAHCFEGALLGAFLLSLHGHKPLILALIASETPLKGQGRTRDFDHCVVPFKVNGYWGALSKTNHAVLRYREPVYKTIRELVMSYFHEYFVSDGTKTLRYYTKPLNINQITRNWITATEDLWEVDEALDHTDRYVVVPESQQSLLRKADPIEIEAGNSTEWNRSKRKKGK